MLLVRMDVRVAVFCLLSTVLLIGSSQGQSDITVNLTCNDVESMKAEVVMHGVAEYVLDRTMVVFLRDSSCNTSSSGHGLHNVTVDTDNNRTGHTLTYKQTISLVTLTGTCNGTFLNGTDYLIVEQTAFVKVTDHVRTKVERVYYYEYKLKCVVPRNRPVNRDPEVSFLVDPNLVDPSHTFNATKDYHVSFGSALYKDADFTTPLIGDPALVSSKDTIYMQINQTSSTTEFKFVTKLCAASPSATYNPSVADIFFQDGCRLDSTFNILTPIPSPNKFQFGIRSFNYIDENVAVYIHCQLYICTMSDDSDACKQRCKSTGNRQRRDVEDYRDVVVVTSGAVAFNRDLTCSQLSCPLNSKCYDHEPAECICDDGYVMSTKTNKCTAGRQFAIEHIRLDQPWDASVPFHRYATKFEKLLLRLFHATKTNDHIEGVKVISVKKGSIILDVTILHTMTSSPQAAYSSFVKAISTDIVEATTVRRIIKLVEENYVASFGRAEKAITDVQLAIILFTLAVVALLCVIPVLIIKHKREKRKAAKKVITSDNKGMEIEL